MERNILRVMLVFGLVALTFTFRRKNIKDWGIVFFSAGFFVSFIANIIIKGNKVRHNIRLLPQYFQTNILYEYLMLPLACVWYNQTTENSKPRGIISQALLYSGIHTLIEGYLEWKTALVEWKNWNWVYNICSLTLIFLGSRGLISIFRRVSKDSD
jgi:hypothetical protein